MASNLSGYVAVGLAQGKGMPPVIVDNYDGQMMSPYGADPTKAVLFSRFPATPLDDYKGIGFAYQPGPDVYPLTLVSFMWVRRDVRSLQDSSALLKAFITVLLSDEARALMPTFGFPELPSDLLAWSRTAIDMLYVDPESQPFTFEASMQLTNQNAIYLGLFSRTYMKEAL